MKDVIIIGAGPAGVSAAIYASSRGKDVLLIEQNKIGGVIGGVSTVTHYSGIIENETGESFAKRLKNQVESAGIEIVYEKMQSVNLKGDVKSVKTDKNEYTAKKIIIANGTTPRRIGITGEDKLYHKGIYMNAAKDGEKYRGKDVFVVGGADGAVKEALYLSDIAKSVTIIHFEQTLGCIAEFLDRIKTKNNIKVITSSRLKAVYGEEYVNALDIENIETGEVNHITSEGCGIFIYAGTTPNTELYTDLTLKDGYIPVDENMQTEIENVYAVGDIRVKTVRQVSTAVSDGAIAGIMCGK